MHTSQKYNQGGNVYDAEPLSWRTQNWGRQTDDMKAAKSDWYSTKSVDSDIPASEISRTKSLLDGSSNYIEGSRLSWRTTESGTGGNLQSEPRARPLLGDPYAVIDLKKDTVDEASLSWRSAQSDMSAAKPSIDNSLPKSLVDSPGKTLNQTTASDLRNGNQTDPYLPPTKSVNSVKDTQENSSSQDPAATDTSDTSKPKPLLGGGNAPPKESRISSLFDEPTNLSWRTTELGRRYEDVQTTKSDWDSANSENRVINEPSNLSWRSTAMGRNFEDKVIKSDWHSANTDRPIHDTNNSERLSWRSANTGSNNIVPPKPLFPAEESDRPINDTNNTASQSLNSADTDPPKSSEDPPKSSKDPPKALLSVNVPDRPLNDENIPDRLSWRSLNSDPYANRPKSSLPVEGSDRLLNNGNNTDRLSWRGANSGSDNIAPSRSLLPVDGPDRSLDRGGLSWRSTGNGRYGDIMRRPFSRQEIEFGGYELGKRKYSDSPPLNSFGLRKELSTDREHTSSVGPWKDFY